MSKGCYRPALDTGLYRHYLNEQDLIKRERSGSTRSIYSLN